MNAGEAAVAAAWVTVAGSGVVGTLTLVGALLGPWVRDSANEKALRERERLAARKQAIAEFCKALISLEHKLRVGDDALVDRARVEANARVIDFGATLTLGEGDALSFAMRAYGHIEKGDCPNPGEVIDITWLSLTSWDRGALELSKFATQDLDDFHATPVVDVTPFPPKPTA